MGRVDRIGQESEKIFCYSFLPNEGLERLIKLKSRIKRRLQENAEVIGTDEQFFQGEDQVLLEDLYSEKSSVLDKEILEDIDLPSYALEIWNRAIKNDPELKEKIEEMPNSVHSSKRSTSGNRVLLFAKTNISNNILEIDESYKIVNENQKDILDKAACEPNTPYQEKMNNHYKILRFGLKKIEEELKSIDMVGRLGSNRNPRKKAYKLFEKIQNKNEEDEKIINDIYEYPLLSNAEHTLARMFRRRLSDKEILDHIREWYRSETFLNKKESKRMNEKPRIICSIGLVKK